MQRQAAQAHSLSIDYIQLVMPRLSFAPSVSSFSMSAMQRAIAARSTSRCAGCTPFRQAVSRAIAVVNAVAAPPLPNTMLSADVRYVSGITMLIADSASV